MLAKIHSAALLGISAIDVEVEVNAFQESKSFNIVGLPDAAVRESRERVMAAVENTGLLPRLEDLTVTVNLAPANVRKEGPAFDLPIALGLLAAMGALPTVVFEGVAALGEITFSGEVRPVRGVLSAVMELRQAGFRKVLVPQANSVEASVVQGIDVIPVNDLCEAVDYLLGKRLITPCVSNLESLITQHCDSGEDFADVKGQETARRAIEVAVAGGHNILLIGSPGSGKTMLARRIPSILPPLTVEEALEVTRIHSAAGVACGETGFALHRPFRSPHHTATAVALVGGGMHLTPGEVSLAHRGVLFLDEFPEFSHYALEVLRQPLEDGKVSIARASAACEFPCRFMLVAAMNPCPCGFFGDPVRPCHCGQARILNYQARVSGPLLDRIDLQVAVPSVPPRELLSLSSGESSASIRARVVAARQLQVERFKDMPGVACNADIPQRDLADVCKLTPAAMERLQLLLSNLNFSARAYSRVLKVARTIADLRASVEVSDNDVFEASSYRSLEQSTQYFL